MSKQSRRDSYHRLDLTLLSLEVLTNRIVFCREMELTAKKPVANRLAWRKAREDAEEELERRNVRDADGAEV